MSLSSVRRRIPSAAALRIYSAMDGLVGLLRDLDSRIIPSRAYRSGWSQCTAVAKTLLAVDGMI